MGGCYEKSMFLSPQLCIFNVYIKTNLLICVFSERPSHTYDLKYMIANINNIDFISTLQRLLPGSILTNPTNRAFKCPGSCLRANQEGVSPDFQLEDRSSHGLFKHHPTVIPLYVQHTTAPAKVSPSHEHTDTAYLWVFVVTNKK